jgi:tetratricopeptide (TPR) repeat protein
LVRVWFVIVVWVGFCLLPGHSRAEETGELFEEAQKAHLGIDRPRDVRKAIDLYLKVAKRDAKHRDARYNLAHLCFLQKRYDLAEKYYREVLKIDSKDADAYNNLGTIYERQGKIEAAERLYRQAIRVSSTIAMPHYNLARLHYGRGEEVQARAAIERALALEPENDVFIKLQAEVLGTLGGLSNTTILLVVGGFGGVMGVYTVLYLKGKVVG